MNSNKNKITKQKFTEAIYGSYGIISNIARKLGCTRRAIYYFLDKDENVDLKTFINDEKDLLLDLAESNLIKALKSKDKNERKWSSLFILNTMGANRGYGNKVDNTNRNIDYKAMIDNLEKTLPQSLTFVERIAAGEDIEKVYSEFKYYMSVNKIKIDNNNNNEIKHNGKSKMQHM